LVIWKQCCGVALAPNTETASDAPATGRGVIDLRAGQKAGAPCNQHPAIAEQGRGLSIASGIQAARHAPSAGGRVVDFRGGDDPIAAGNKDRAIGKEGCRMSEPTRAEASGILPLKGSGETRLCCKPDCAEYYWRKWHSPQPAWDSYKGFR